MGPMVLLVLTISFFLVRLAPGNPFSREGRQLPEAVLQNLNEKYGLDVPLYKQYFNWMGRVLHFDFGPSIKYPDRTVNEIIGESVTVSAGLGILAYTIALVFGLTGGILAAYKRNSWIDYLSSSISILGVSVPNFVLGPLLVLFFSLTLYWLPPARIEWAAVIGPIDLHWLIVILSLTVIAIYIGLAYLGFSRVLIKIGGVLGKGNKNVSYTLLAVSGIVGLAAIFFFLRPSLHWQGISFPLSVKLPQLRSVILPAVTLSAIYLAYIMRLTRSGMIETLNQDYVRTARAKGLPESRVIFGHALRGAILPVVSFTGPALASLIAGTVVVEKIFAIPGLGNYFVNAAFNRDYFLLLGITAFVSTLLMLMNLLVDIGYALIDPRIRYQ
jgi:ABC-type dipeptide/oligopeptide/nickel transport system permease component